MEGSVIFSINLRFMAEKVNYVLDVRQPTIIKAVSIEQSRMADPLSTVLVGSDK